MTSLFAAALAQELRVGGVIQTKGKHKIIGWNALRAIEAWKEWVNGADLGYTVKLDFRDAADEDDANQIADVVSAMVDADEVDVVFAPYTSGASKVLLNKLHATDKPIMVWGGASESIFTQEQRAPNAFGTFTPAGEYMTSGLTELKAQGAKNIALVTMDNAFSNAVCEGANATAEKMGFEFLDFKVIDNDADAEEIEERLINLTDAAKDADVVVACGHKTPMISIVKKMRELLITPKVVLATQVAAGSFKGNFVGDAAEEALCGLMMPTQWVSVDSDSDKDPVTGWDAASFSTYFKSYTGWEPTYHSASAAAAGVAIVNALNAVSGDKSQLAVALKLLRIDSFYGHIQFTPDGRSTGKPMLTVQNKRGPPFPSPVVAPAQYKEDEMTFGPACPPAPFFSTQHETPGVSMTTLLWVTFGLCFVCAVITAGVVLFVEEEQPMADQEVK